MAGGGRGDADGLIPALPEQVVIAHVVPRLPWYVRPVCRALSKSWRAWMDDSTKRLDLQLRSRECQLPFLDGCVLILTFDRRVFIARGGHGMAGEERQEVAVPCGDEAYQIDRQWRQLPPLPRLFPSTPLDCGALIASSGMVYVWLLSEPENFVLKMDMGCGDWTWNKFLLPHPFNEEAIHFNSKIYVPSHPFRNPGNQKVVLVYDMSTDHCELMKTWSHYNLGIVRQKHSCTSSGQGGEEKLYSFVAQEPLSEPPKFDVLTYDACRESWMSGETVCLPAHRWSELGEVKLANGDCFEPATDVGINTLWINHDWGNISWFNPSLHETQVALNASLEGTCLRDVKVIRGALYAIFGKDECDQKEEDRAEQLDRKLVKLTLMKGRISVGNKTVNWEEVLDVGIFRRRSDDYVFPAIRHYTWMA